MKKAKSKTSARGTVRRDTRALNHPDVTPEARELYKIEPPRKSHRYWEESLLNTSRKLTEDQRIALMVYAEALAIARIKAKLGRKAEARQGVKHGS